MITFKCKMCGGDLEITDGSSICECTYCGTQQTLPKAEDDQRANRYNRANHYRRQNEFDKAIAAYEKILEESDQDAEAHWGVVLSRFGIEYVEDPVSHKWIPTCHRVQIASILADEDYLAAVEYAPDEQSRQVYEQQAAEIAEIQKRILVVSQNEKPYDVFICYKETDEHNQRTRDSSLAQEVYYGLTEHGFKVFFSRFTLEDKLGQEYEPYIFAALHSAKVMVVIGTKPEYFNAVWVKNEWSRYLGIMANDRHRLLIPCYRDMDPYDLPEELGNLQSQDMSKIGFIQDLIRGINKIFADEDSKAGKSAESVRPAFVSGSGNLDALLERAYLSIEDEEYDKADELCEAVLNLDARNVRAYLGKLLADLKVNKLENLEKEKEPFDSNPQYKKILRFDNGELKAQLEQYNHTIRERKERTADADARTEIIKRNFKREVVSYCIIDKEIKSENEELQKTVDLINRANNAINRYQSEIDHSNGLFTGKRKKALREYIDFRDEKIYRLGITADNISSNIEQAQAAQMEKPDHKMMVYLTAREYYEAGLFERAAQEYIKIADYKDVPRLIANDSNLKNAIDPLMRYKEKCMLEEAAESKRIYTEAAADAENAEKKRKHEKAVEEFTGIGNIVRFGSFIQIRNEEAEPIEWIVINSSDNYAYLLSYYGLEAKAYSSEMPATWKNSIAREWLNNNFYHVAFSEKEKNVMSSVYVNNERSQGFQNSRYDGGPNTYDKVFLLSVADVESLLSESALLCYPTPYVQSDFVYKGKDGSGSWWLRSPGKNKYNTAMLHYDKDLIEDGSYDEAVLYRPAIVIDLKKLASEL